MIRAAELVMFCSRLVLHLLVRSGIGGEELSNKFKWISVKAAQPAGSKEPNIARKVPYNFDVTLRHHF